MTFANRVIQSLNLVGVAALAALCVVQWRANSRATESASRLEQVRQVQAAKLDEQTKTLQSDEAQLDDLHQHLSRTESALKAEQAELSAANAARNALVEEREQLHRALNQWQAALRERDAAIGRAGEQIQKLALERDDAVRRSNELVASLGHAPPAGTAETSNR